MGPWLGGGCESCQVRQAGRRDLHYSQVESEIGAVVERQACIELGVNRTVLGEQEQAGRTRGEARLE